MKIFLLALSLFLAPSFTSCTRSPVSSPSPVQSIDLTIARSLLDAQTIIEQAKVLVTEKPTLKDPLNKIITSYNSAQSAYLIFHQAIILGKNPDPTVLQTQIASLISEVTQLVGMLK